MTPDDPTTPPEEVDAGLAFAYGEDAEQDSSPSVLERIADRTGSTPRVSLRDAGPDPTPMLRPLREGDPRRAGRYVVQGELGRGGVGAVHRGHDQELGRDVALKFVLEKYKDEPEILQRFIEEAQIGGQLQHPGIVPVYDLGMAKGRPFFAMKLVKGETLAKQLAARESVADDRRAFLSIFEDVCQTMAYAHARGVVHRDLKPANVMIGSFGEVQVVDWGLGKVLKQGGVADEALSARDAPAATVVETVRSSGDGSRSVVGSVMGTPAYMPPEQARGEVEAMDERSDVFALGAILCEVLTGKPPYVGDRSELIAMAASADLAGARERLSTCGGDPDLVELTERCLAPSAAARPRSAEVVAQAVHEYLAAAEARVHEAQVEAAEALVRAASLKRAQRLGLGLTAAIALGLVASLALWRRAEDARVRAIENGARAERELARANEVKGLIRDMLGSVMPQEALFADTTLMEGILDDAAARLERGEVADELVAAELHDLVGNVYRSLSRFDAAARHLPKALEITERLLGERDDRTIVVMWHLARLYVELGRAREAEELLRRAVDLHDCPRGELCPTYMSALGTLGGAYVALDRKAEADEIFREALALNTAAFGPYHPETLDSRGMLAMNLMNLGHLDEAARSMRETVAALEETRARDHPHTVDWKVHLVAILEDQGHLEEALDIALECVEIGERCWGPENTRTLRAKKKLADVSSSLGRGEEAERLYLELVESYRRLLGEEHRDTLALRNNLARNYAQMGRMDDGLRIERDALPTAARVLGDDDSLTVLIQCNLAAYARNVGALVEAEAHGRAVLEKRTRRLGAEDPETLEAMGALARTLNEAQRSDDAEALLRDVLAIRRRRGIPDDPDALQLRKDLAWSVLVQGRFDDAGELYDDLMARVERELAPDDPLRLSLQTDVATSYCLQGRQVEGCVLLEQTLEQMELTLGPEDRRTLITAGNLAYNFLELELYDDAIATLEPYLAASRRVFDPPTLRRHLDTVGRAHQALGHRSAARELFAEQLDSELAPAERPDASPRERNGAAWRLLTHEREDLQDPARALALAELACRGEEERGGGSLYAYLDTLSLAQERTGDAAGALETQRRAVSLIPEDADPGTVAEVRRRLAELEEAAE